MQRASVVGVFVLFGRINTLRVSLFNSRFVNVRLLFFHRSGCTVHHVGPHTDAFVVAVSGSK